MPDKSLNRNASNSPTKGKVKAKKGGSAIGSPIRDNTAGRPSGGPAKATQQFKPADGGLHIQNQSRK